MWYKHWIHWITQYCTQLATIKYAFKKQHNPPKDFILFDRIAFYSIACDDVFGMWTCCSVCCSYGWFHFRRLVIFFISFFSVSYHSCMTLAHSKTLSKFFLFMPSNAAHRFQNRNPNDSTIKHIFYSSYDNEIMRKQRAHSQYIHTAKNKWTEKKRRNKIYRLKRHKWYKLTKRTHSDQIKIDNNNNYPQKKEYIFRVSQRDFIY